MAELNEAEIGRWRIICEEYLADEMWKEKRRHRDERRQVTAEGLNGLLAGFLESKVDLDTFRDTFHNKTINEWTGYGLKGLSGGMFLNMLVKYIPDQEAVARELRAVLPAPDDFAEGESRMRRFHDFLVKLIEDGAVKKVNIQPARLAFFVSAWWNVQKITVWPIFYTSGRKALSMGGLYKATAHPVDDYLAFRGVFVQLAKALGLPFPDLEYLLIYYRDRQALPPDLVVEVDPGDEVDPEDEVEGEGEISHTQVQWLLARMGRSLGCNVWIASNDQKKEWNGQKLGDLSIDALPALGMDSDSQKVIRLIDVVWLQGTNQIAAAFEIEKTTSVYSGLLRMADLVSLSPNISFPLYIVAPEGKMAKVRKELLRPAFRTLGLQERCGYFSDERLVKEAKHIEKYATGPSAIDKLAAHVDDGEDE